MYDNIIDPYLQKFYNTLGDSKIKKIIEYSVSGGKCIRGFIVKHIIDTYTKKETNLWGPIVAVELVHTASLIIDDLPCMDNDKFRRNKKSTFNAFSEREAILSSIYIISQSLKITTNCYNDLKKGKITHNNNDLQILINFINEWSELLGKNLVVGQLLDLKSNVEELFNLKLNLENDKLIIIYKTCSLFMLSFIQGAIFSEKENVDIEEFKNMGLYFGIMFQLMDDYNDIEQDKTAGSYNYINKYSLNDAIVHFYESKMKLVDLLKKNELLTEDFITLINNISSKFIPLENHSLNNNLI